MHRDRSTALAAVQRVAAPSAIAALFAFGALAAPAAAQTVGASSLASGHGTAVTPEPRLGVLDIELAGESLSAYPHFHYVRTVEIGKRVSLAIDPTRYPSFVGQNADIYVVAHKTMAQWIADGTLIDARGAPTNFTFQPGTIQANTVMLDNGTLNADAGADLGVPYDVVVDFDQDGFLGAGDAIDGFAGEPGFFVVEDPGLPGPYAVTEIQYSGGSFLGQDTYYPTNIDQLGVLPLVVISHGNGHDYRWYDHIGYHLASWGCVVMSHQNNTVPGPESASVTTLTNTDYIFTNQGSIQNGALAGHLDPTRIVWIGHSRGGEGVVRAYNKIATGAYIPVNYLPSGVKLVSSIAPTEFLSVAQINPFSVNYHMFVGASDSDVTGGPTNAIVQSTPIYERSIGDKTFHSIQGAGHADFHNQSGNCWCTGPNLIGKAGTHPVVLSNYLALVKHYTEGSVAARDYFERTYDDFHSASIPANVIVANEHKDAAGTGNFVVDDFQTNTALNTSSSGAAVNVAVANPFEGLMQDLDGSFSWSSGVPMNGMCRAISGDTQRGLVFDWTTPSSLTFDVLTSQKDFSDDVALSFRACQGTRHPNTDSWNQPLTFGVELEDVFGNVTTTLDFGAFGRLTRTYQRSGTGTGSGWANEFSTLRIPMDAFTRHAPNFDLTQVAKIRFRFGVPGATLGRVGIDDIEIIAKGN
ncbi:MAG: hypothetical protein L6Q99_06040 [Planctomycetes bacterium]|nr:hypothetical protein [Planctomycetota bacterium]